MIRRYRGSCHCGRIAFEVDGELGRVAICNCTICAKKGYLHWVVAWAQFRLLTPIEDLATYSFNTRQAKHHFCPVCGVTPFHLPRGNAECVDVNVRCLENAEHARLAVEYFDGCNWELSHLEREARD
jgi:hypothetical protein